MCVTYSHLSSSLLISLILSIFLFYLSLFRLPPPLLPAIIQPSRDALDNKAVRSQSRLINQLFLLYSQWRRGFAPGPFHWMGSRKCLDGVSYIKSCSGKWAYSARQAMPSTRAYTHTSDHMHTHKHAQRRSQGSVLHAKCTGTCFLSHTLSGSFVYEYRSQVWKLHWFHVENTTAGNILVTMWRRQSW